MKNSPLAKAFRYHLQQFESRVRSGAVSLTHGTRAARIMALAREDVANGKARYPNPIKPYATATRQEDGKTYVENPDSCGLRLVGMVEAESAKITKSEFPGWFTDPYGDSFKDGTGLCWGEVYQLPGRNRKARYVAAYQFGGQDGGPIVDLREIFEDDRRGGSSYDDNSEALRDACRSADHMAEHAAESEREYQAAWQAGNRFADLLNDIKAAQAENAKLRVELRALADLDSPIAKKTIRDKIRKNVESIQEWRTARKQLRDGQGESRDDCYRQFGTYDKRLVEAFREGAQL